MNFKSIQSNDYFPYLVWALLMALALLFSLFGFHRMSETATGTSFMIWALIAFGILLGICAKYFITHARPLAKIRRALLTLIHQDLPAIQSALMELTMGNLKMQVRMQSGKLPKRSPFEIRDLSESLQRLQTNLYLAMEDFNTITDIPCKRLCYVGANTIEEGRRAGLLIGKLMHGKGRLLICTAFRSSTSLELRWKSCRNTLGDHFPGIEIVDILETREDIQIIRKYIETLFETFPDLGGVYATDAVSTSAFPGAMTEIHPEKKPVIVGHDLTKANLECLKKGTLSASLGQNPYAQGHDPLIHLYNHVIAGWRPDTPQLYTQIDEVTQKNLPLFLQEKTGRLTHRNAFASLAKVADIPAIRPLRFAVLYREDNEFWEQIHQGALAAQEKLTPLGVTVDWVVAEKTHTRSYDSTLYGPMMDRLIERNVYDGISTVIFDKQFTRYINKAVDAGIPVIVMNSEPLSLRSTLDNISGQADQLNNVSAHLSSTAQHVLMASNEIRNILSQISDGAIAQNKQRERTQETLTALLNNIAQVGDQARESRLSTTKTEEAVTNSGRAVKTMHASVQMIGGSIEKSMAVVKELKKHSEEIDDMIGAISTISSKVNVLALNASIEATQSGKYQAGFSKVAKEIRKLAQNTANATREISTLVKTIRMDVTRVAKAVNSGNELIQNSTQSIESADQALNNIHHFVDSEKARVEKIATLIQDMQVLSHQVGMAMDHVNAVSQRNKQGIEENNNALQLMNTQLGSITEMAGKLEEMSQVEKQLLAMFETDTD